MNTAELQVKTEARDDGFNAGVIMACAVVRGFDDPTTWREIVRTAGTQQILVHALMNEGDWEWGGFAKYARSELGAIEVDKAKQTARRLQRKAQKEHAA